MARFSLALSAGPRFPTEWPEVIGLMIRLTVFQLVGCGFNSKRPETPGRLWLAAGKTVF